MQYCQNLLVIGPLKNNRDSTKSGGVIVLMECFLVGLRKNGVEHIVIDTNNDNYS